MLITVFGANGKVGSLVVSEALKRGHQVTAFVHIQSKFAEQDKLLVVSGDIYDTDQVAQAIEGSEAIISALGSWGTPKKDILTVGMRHIIPAMQKNKINRIVSLTGGAANAPKDKVTLADQLSHALLMLFAAKILTDGEEHLNLLSQTDLDWTVIRSPIMNERGNSKGYKLLAKRPSPLATINRHAVAQAMVDLVELTDHKQQSPFITR